MLSRLPVLTICLAGLISLVSLLSVQQIIDGQSLYLHSQLFRGVSWWAPFTYWLVIDKAPSLILALLPLFLFGAAIEKTLSRWHFLLLFFGGTLFAAVIYGALFASVGKVLAANGALCAGVSLCGATFVFSITNRIPNPSSQLPLWLLCLLFVAGVASTAMFVPQASYENVAFRTSSFVFGALAAVLLLRRIPKEETDETPDE